MSKILRSLKKITWLTFQNSVFLFAKNRHHVIITFKMLKTEFIFEYTKLGRKIYTILASLFQ